jgi:hypothetical protein
MIDEIEKLPVLISCQRNGNNILLRFDQDVFNQNKNDDCILIIDITGSKESDKKIDEIKKLIGSSIDYHIKRIKDDDKSISFINTETLEQIDLTCKEVEESRTELKRDDLFFRCDILSRLYSYYKNQYDKVYSKNENIYQKILKHVENEVNILEQKEVFFQKSEEPEKHIIIKSKLETYREFYSLIKEAT